MFVLQHVNLSKPWLLRIWSSRSHRIGIACKSRHMLWVVRCLVFIAVFTASFKSWYVLRVSLYTWISLYLFCWPTSSLNIVFDLSTFVYRRFPRKIGILARFIILIPFSFTAGSSLSSSNLLCHFRSDWRYTFSGAKQSGNVWKYIKL